MGFVIVGAFFFMLNLFVGNMVFNFYSVKSQLNGLFLLTEQQKLWVETQSVLLNFHPIIRLKPRDSSIEQRCFYIATSHRFEFIIGIVILLNVVLLCLDHEDSSPNFYSITNRLDMVFSAIFLCEAAIKIIALNHRYFWDAWNRFDFFLVLSSVASIVMELLSEDTHLPINPSVLRVFRVFRALRILRLIHKAKKKFNSARNPLFLYTQYLEYWSVHVILFFVYSVLCVQLFGLVVEGEFLTSDANFKNFPQALLLLIRITTGEEWNGIMHESHFALPFMMHRQVSLLTRVAPLLPRPILSPSLSYQALCSPTYSWQLFWTISTQR